MNHLDSSQLDWEKMNHLIPAIVQHALTGDVLMLGYMDPQALEITQVTRKLTLYSRSKQRIWRKGETSGNHMDVVCLAMDCDGDSLLVMVIPSGPACHLGTISCFTPSACSKISFLGTLASVIRERGTTTEASASYTQSLLTQGIARCAQKVGEEAVETVIASMQQDRDGMIAESADLLFHLLVLLEASQISVFEVVNCLEQRHQQTLSERD